MDKQPYNGNYWEDISHEEVAKLMRYGLELSITKYARRGDELIFAEPVWDRHDLTGCDTRGHLREAGLPNEVPPGWSPDPAFERSPVYEPELIDRLHEPEVRALPRVDQLLRLTATEMFEAFGRGRMNRGTFRHQVMAGEHPEALRALIYKLKARRRDLEKAAAAAQAYAAEQGFELRLARRGFFYYRVSGPDMKKVCPRRFGYGWRTYYDHIYNDKLLAGALEELVDRALERQP